jgi:hypothetical protein
MSPLIALLLQLLFSFIEMLIQKWLGSASALPSLEALSIEKEAFLSKVRWRLWLGPARMMHASKAYDLAIQNYKKVLSASEGSPLGNLKASVVADQVVTPIGSEFI